MSEQTIFQNVPLECVQPSTTNPRKHFNQTALAELAESIKQHGVAQPILVRPIERVGNSIIYYEIVAGERRYRASSLAGYSTVPAIVRTLSDVEALEIQVIENLQRADLHPLEEAEGYEQLMKLHHFTADQLADKVGKSRAYIYARLKLCALEPAARAAFFEGTLTASTALLVARIPVKKLQQEAVKEITQRRYDDAVMTTREAQRHIERTYMLQLKDAPFKTSDEKLCPSAGACGSCKKRTGNQPELFSDIESTDVCTDPVCFGEKRDAHTNRLRIQAEVTGQTIISGPEAKKIMPYSYSGDLKNGYVNLDAKCYADEETRTFRQILGEATPAPALLENPHSDGFLEVVRVTDIEQLLKEQGIAAPRSENSNANRDEEKKQEAKAKIEKEYRRQLFTAVRAKSNAALDKNDLRTIAAMLFRQCPNTEQPMIMALYGWDKSINEWPDRNKNLKAAIDKLDGQQAAQLIRDLTLAGDLTISSHNFDKSKPEKLLAAAARVGVDPDPIKAAVKAEAKAKLDAKKPAVKKIKADKKAPEQANGGKA